jgi:hypothetical protein
MGREAASLTPEQAAGHIAGFVILSDWSARDLQFREMDGRLGPFKGKDFGSSIGPIFVTPDEIEGRRQGNGYDLEMTSTVNGRRYGADRWTSAYWSMEDLISYASWNSRVESGSMIGSGTCQGGCILELSLRNSPQAYPWHEVFGRERSLSTNSAKRSKSDRLLAHPRGLAANAARKSTCPCRKPRPRSRCGLVWLMMSLLG